MIEGRSFWKTANGRAADGDVLRHKALRARQMAEQARTTEARQHYDGMADYWEQLLVEPDRVSDPPRPM